MLLECSVLPRIDAQDGRRVRHKVAASPKALLPAGSQVDIHEPPAQGLLRGHNAA